MLTTKWIENKKHFKTFENIDLDNEIIDLLLNRGIDDEKKITKFINSNLENISTPFSLKDVDKGVELIFNAIKNKKNIWIYGDYDVDGITSTSLSYLSLKEIYDNVFYYIPLRDEGYGLNKEALEYIKKEGGDLVITVDCGISSIDEVDFANSIELDIIITDHHEINNKLPNAKAVINPKRDENEFEFKYLAGVGTVFMLLYGLYIKLGIKNEIFKFIDIVAIGTVADIVPLVEENRIFVKHGLKKLRDTKNIGLKKLLKNIYGEYKNKELDTYDIGFIIAPVFNAAGRLEDAKKAVRLIITNSETEAEYLSKELIEQNNERKDIQNTILEKVEKDIISRGLDKRGAIVSYSRDYHHGIIGIVASKIVDKYYKPTIIMEVKETEKIAVASCRSIENFNIMDALNSMKEVFLKYGGHAGAAGFSIEIDKITEFENKLDEYCKKILGKDDYIKPLKIDRELIIDKISFEFFEKLKLLKPFGFSNPNPIFSIRNIRVTNVRLIGKEKTHLMFDIIKESIYIRNLVWFNNGHMKDNLELNKFYNIAVKLKQEMYKDKYYIKLYVEDIKESDGKDNKIKNYIDKYNLNFPLKSVFYTKEKLDINDNLAIEFDEEFAKIKNGFKIVGFLNKDIFNNLIYLKKNFNFNYIIKIKKIEEKEANYNIFIEIDRDYNFNSFSIKEANIFNDIKKFLISDFEYNSFQKKVLGAIFKDKKTVLAVTKYGRGIDTIYLTLAIYLKTVKEKKILLITKDKKSKFLKNYLDISNEYIKGYDFYIYDNINPKDFIKNSLVISYSDIDNIDNRYFFIKDSINEKNIVILTEDELIRKGFDEDNIYTKKIPILEKKHIVNLLKTKEIIYGTRDLRALL
ncbi:single-stranded-DNA-specific exonuclease [Hypnocyclicus thermotrophus]|uniref:Single-stranded-DNA-specific exonuclease RecJ n=1 Tax=Hypnocyclicus thermotrophus TaxID=1627895 RepID=A0AA46DZ02_9FUSO|nr:single-stranded-DNA-specific exonuclease RecJ [Hypnocyclicus thermotrophus]TDT71405.1 single-stranded-DNA-specific exonuclease [Hypnocyclicus thermotrophus]